VRTQEKEFRMANIRIYQKPTCTTCRQAVQILKESGTPFTTVNYYEKPFSKAQLKSLLRKAALSPRELLRAKEPLFKEFGLANRKLSDDELIDLMLQHPDLIQRPIVEKGEKAMLARPADTVKHML
jgi:arsenate reductase (glutaredoxin)